MEESYSRSTKVGIMHSTNLQSRNGEMSLTIVVRRGNHHPQSARARNGFKRRFKKNNSSSRHDSPRPHTRTRGQTRQRGGNLTSVETVKGHFSLQVLTTTTLGLRRPRAAPAPRASLPASRSRAGTPQRAAQVALGSPPPRFPAGLIPLRVPPGCCSLVLIKPEWP